MQMDSLGLNDHTAHFSHSGCRPAEEERPSKLDVQRIVCREGGRRRLEGT